MVNKVILIGTLGKDAETKTLIGGTQVSSFSLATSESYKDKADVWQQSTEWHNVVIWRPSSTVMSLQKGSKAYVEGKITNRKYQDKEGQERTTTEIVASTVRKLDS